MTSRTSMWFTVSLYLYIAVVSSYRHNVFTRKELAQLLEEKLPKTKESYDSSLGDKDKPSLTTKLDLLQLIQMFSKNGLASEVVDFGKKLKEVNRQRNETSKFMKSGNLDHFDLDVYHTYDEILWFLSSISRIYKESTDILTIGRTPLYKPMVALKISKPGELEFDKPLIWLQAGLHSNEWIGPAVLLYFIRQMVIEDLTSPLDAILSRYHVIVLPVVNIDGYEYTWTEDRLWRKNLQKTEDCEGIDLNRNWIDPEDFEIQDDEELSHCSGGEAMQSENKNIQQYIRKQNGNVKIAIGYHGYNQLMMIPYGKTSSKPRNYQKLMELCKKATQAIKMVHGKTYKYGTINDLVGTIKGNNVDYFYDHLGIPYTFAVALRDIGTYKSLLPANQIIPTAEENMAAFQELALNV